jgi:Domain of unknown function (DUF4291)
LQRKRASPVRVQWDPERSIDLGALPWRTIQVGLAATAAQDYVSEWIIQIVDVTQPAHDLHRLLSHSHQTAEAKQHLPEERPYPLPRAAAQAVGATPPT